MNAAGTAALPNAIGVANRRARQYIGGNVRKHDLGIQALASCCRSGGNTISGNRIGTDLPGNAARANGGDGISVGPGSSSTQILNNQISGNTGNGVSISGNNVTGCVIGGNIIGLNANGTAALPDALDGVLIAAGAHTNTIGGTAAADRNTISGNLQNGIRVSGTGTSGNSVLGNFIGTDVTGTIDLGNTSWRIDQRWFNNSVVWGRRRLQRHLGNNRWN